MYKIIVSYHSNISMNFLVTRFTQIKLVWKTRLSKCDEYNSRHNTTTRMTIVDSINGR